MADAAASGDALLLGIDIGGTNTKVALLDRAGAVLETATEPTDRGGAEATVRTAAGLARRWVAAHPGIAAVGVTIPGHFDAEGCATIVPNLPGPWQGRPVRGPVREAAARPVVLLNDARAHGLAESALGAGRDAGVVVTLVLGTGVGGAIVIDGRLHAGASGLAGEIGHSVVLADGPACGCGNRGCLESLVRADVAAAAAGTATVEEAVARADAGDPRARAAIAESARWIGIALGNVATVVGPEVIVIGGGGAQAGEPLLGPLREEFLRRTPLLRHAPPRIVPALLGPTAGAIGAAIAAGQLPPGP